MDPRLAALAREAPGAGDLTGPGVGTGSAEHPVCGDVVRVQVRCVLGRIEALAWRAKGCPATLAVAAAAHAALVGALVAASLGEARAELSKRLADRLAALGGLARHERHAERIFQDALDQALREGLRCGPALA